MNNKPNILIVGGTGFIGSYIAEILTEKGNFVAVVHRRRLDPRRVMKGILYKKGLNSKPDWAKDIETVIISTQPDSHTFKSILEYLAKLPNLRKIIYLSTVQLYPDSIHCQEETAPTIPLSKYEKLKDLEERKLLGFIGKRNIALCVARLSNVYGDIQNRGIIDRLIRQLLYQDDLIINGDGEQKKDLIFIEDVAELVSYLVSRNKNAKYEVFNLSTGQGYSINEVIATLESLTGKSLVFKRALFPNTEKKNSIADNKKIMRTTGYSLRYDLVGGLKKTLDNYINKNETGNIFKGKTILVTGGTGSIGSELVRQLLKYEPKQIRVLSRNETRQYDLLESLKYPQNLRMLIGDIRDRERLQLAFNGVNIVFHAAALKHVPFCEYNPSEAMKTNIIGTHNVIDAAVHAGAERVIAISTDKVANPFNVLGVSKLMMEKLLINSNFFLDDKLKLACVRFGNVAWSSGSVLPMWKNQVKAGKTINVTDRDATRFFMSIKQAVSLTLKSAKLCQGGEIFILKMPSARLGDLADLFVKKYCKDKIKIKDIGSRAGDKLHEDLLGLNDKNKDVWANDEMFILVPRMHIHKFVNEPQCYGGFEKISEDTSFSSENNVNLKKIEQII